jgi:Protein of unknown function (DUF3987)
MSNLDKLAELEAMAKPHTEKAIKQARKYGSTKAAPDKDDYLNEMLGGLQHDEFVEDAVISPPQPTPGMFYGMVGDVARIAGTGTEVNPVAAVTVYLSFLGANVGRDTFLPINNTFHHPRLFTMHIGRSGRGGKGDSQQLTHRIRQRIESIDSALLGKTHSGGLSSREGLATLIHDGFGESPAIADKRLWIIESEFANVLHQSKREGNTLSSALREVWDGGDIKPATKSKAVGVSNPHIGIHANITPAELSKLMGAGEMTNGFANRFLMIWAENTGYVPFPTPTPERLIDDLAEKTIEIIHYAKGGYPNSTNSLEMNLSKAAKDHYAEVYRELRRPLDSEFISAMLERRAPYALRLAMLFALSDQTRVIESCHLQAAMEWIAYAVHTVKFVFADKINNQQQAEARQHAAKILAFLQLRPDGSSIREIHNECFQKHGSGDKIQTALSHLLSENPPRIEQKIVSPGSKGGRPKTIYTLKNSADKLNNLQNPVTTGLEGGLPTADKLRTNSSSEQSKEVCPQFVRIDKNAVNPDTARPGELLSLSAPFLHTSTDAAKENRHSGSQKPKVARKKL